MTSVKVLFLLLFTLSLSSCSDDDNDNQQPTVLGKLIVNEQSFDLTRGFIIPNYTGSDPNYNPRRFYFILSNGSVALKNNKFIYSDSITQAIDFNMYSSTAKSGTIENTTYKNYMWDDPAPNFDFNQAYIDHSGIDTNLVIQNSKYISGNSISSDSLVGQASISNSNGIYSISFSFSNSKNTISGTFKGNLKDLNWEY